MCNQFLRHLKRRTFLVQAAAGSMFLPHCHNCVADCLPQAASSSLSAILELLIGIHPTADSLPTMIKEESTYPEFVWKNLLRGNQAIVLDWGLTDRSDEKWEPIRRAMGASCRLSHRIDLAAMQPAGEIASTGYCLANPGHEYL